MEHHVNFSATTVAPNANLTRTVTRSAESWQFFAFIFAATVTVLLGIVDDLPVHSWVWRILLKIFIFAFVGYWTLMNDFCRNRAISLLGKFKQENH